jgi:biotin carboxyl carrier protein
LGDQKIEVAYVFKKENKLNITIDGIDYVAEIFSSSPKQIVIQIDHHVQSFFIVKKQEDIFIQHPSAGTYQLKEIPRFQLPGSEFSKGDYVAAMPGEVVKILVKAGDHIKAGKPLLVMSSMKMETTIEAHSDGEVEEVFVVEKSFVEANAVLIKMKD